MPPIDPLVPLPPDIDIPHEDDEFEDPTTGITPKGPWDGVGITNPVLAGLKAQLDLTQNPGGFLMLGAAESPVGASQAFEPTQDRRGLYKLVNPAKAASAA